MLNEFTQFWTFHAYAHRVAGWQGWYENDANECVAFLDIDGNLALWNQELSTLTPVKFS